MSEEFDVVETWSFLTIIGIETKLIKRVLTDIYNAKILKKLRVLLMRVSFSENLNHRHRVKPWKNKQFKIASNCIEPLSNIDFYFSTLYVSRDTSPWFFLDFFQTVLEANCLNFSFFFNGFCDIHGKRCLRLSDQKI